MTDRKKLEEANRAYKKSIEKEISYVKSDVNKIGRNALIGGMVTLSALYLTSLLTSKPEKPKKKKKNKKEKTRSASLTSGVLLDTVKDELLILALGFTTKKLADFIKDLKEEEK